MRDNHPDRGGWRAMAMAVALFAITLNFLQPLAHAAVMRDGAPQAIWSAAFCGTPDEAGKPGTAGKHDCCLGLAQATPLNAPPTVFVFVEPIVTAAAPSLPAEQAVPVGIRDGPTRPRGPPLFA